MSERAFLDAIIAEPDEDAHRLVFADWLDENGRSERAEFIRTQCALARMPDDDPRRAEFEVRERRLLAANVNEWAAPWPETPGYEYAGNEPNGAEFRRGFLESIDLAGIAAPAESWGEAFGRLFSAHPIRELNGGKLLVGREELNRVESLSFWATREEFDVGALLRSPHLSRLRRLSWFPQGATGDQVADWLRLPALAQLQAINCVSNRNPSERFVQALARGDLPELLELTLQPYLPTLARSLAKLIRSALWPRLRTLTTDKSEAFPWTLALEHGRFRRLVIRGAYHQACPALAAALPTARCTTLEELDVFGEFCHGEEFSGVLESPALANLRRLTLIFGRLGGDDLHRLARSEVLANLTRLEVYSNDESGSGVLALLRSPKLGRLRRLSVNGRAVHASAVKALAGNVAARGLRFLQFNPESDQALAALVHGEPFPDLRTLSLGWGWRAAPHPAILDAVLNSPKLPRLCVVQFSADADQVKDIAGIFRACDRIAWAGGEMQDGGDGVRVAVKPENVYLPNHLADI